MSAAFDFTGRPIGGLVLKALDDVRFELAGAGDADELNRLFQRFFDEAHYRDRGIVYSPGRAGEWLQRVLSTGSTPHIVARREGAIVGVVSFGLDDTFCERPVAVLHTVYVVPDQRRSAIGLILVMSAINLAREEGACAFHAPIASGLKEQASLANLLRRCGCETIGTILGRSL